MQEQFIALVSHELRTPMNAILGLNSVLLERVHAKPQASKVLEYTKQSAGHLMTVINDVLDYSQIHQGNITARVERFALHDTVRAAFELFLPQIESARLHYACEIGPGVPEWVETDRHRLMQVLVNLLGNAIKFTHHGHVRLKISAQEGGLEFAVEDTGIGIAPEKQVRIFEGFSQADASIQGRYGGSGLGLTISLQLVQMLGGHLQLESQDGTGSRFWFSLPLKCVPAPDKPESRAHEQAGQVQRALRFLVADDHPVNRLLVRQVLSRQWPHSAVVEAEDGQAAVQALMQGPAFDLVLMDMVMPVMDGIEATRKIKASELRAVRSTPVLGLTANVSTTDLERFKAAGLGGLLLKPFDVAQLRAEVLRLMADRLQEKATP
jgi:CheY-like chemotaxis protein